MTADLVEVQTRRPLSRLKPVIEEWTEMVLEFSDQRPDDVCWWYTERATLSILAGAAWRTKNWLALEEYSTSKTIVSDKEDATVRRIKSGRCDLYLKNGAVSFAFEAKQVWQPIVTGRAKAKPNPYIAHGMDDAFADAAQLDKDEAGARVALTFVVPSIAPSTLPTESRARSIAVTTAVEDWLRPIRTNLQWHAYAHVFPKESRLMVPSKGKRVFPGVVMLMRVRIRGISPRGAKAKGQG